MAELNIDCITQILRLNKLQIKNIFAILNSTRLVEPASVQHRILILADVLERLAFLTPEQRTAILTTMWQTVNNSEKCAAGDDLPNVEEMRVLSLLRAVYFADGYFCTWLGHVGWLDLTTGETIEKLPAEPAETIAYNLDVLARQFNEKMNRLASRTQEMSNAGAEQQGSTGTVAKP